MSSSSSTRPAEPAARRTRSGVLYALLAVWCLLIGFAVVSVVNPPWLQALSSGGQATEARGYIASGDHLVRQGDARGAIAWYDRALRADPDNLAAQINRAVACGRAGLVDEGLRSLRAALERDPHGRGVILYNIAELFRQRGDTKPAIAAYREALAAGATPELVLGRLGEVLLATGEPEEARRSLQAALEARENPLTPYREAFNPGRAGGEAEAEHRRAMQEAYARPVTLDDLGRYDLEMVRSQIDRDPERARLRARLAELEAASRAPAASSPSRD